MENKLAATGCGVELFLETTEVDTPLLEAVDRLDEMMERAAKPVQPPDDERVSRAGKARASVSPGRSATLPDTVSVKIFSQPAFVSASCWSARVWSTVETRA
jgi:hypothetical protein